MTVLRYRLSYVTKYKPFNNTMQGFIMTLAAILATFLTTAELQDDYHCATQIAYYEARGEEPYDGKTLPVIITANRVLHDEFPNTICDVMLQPGQYEFVSKGLHLRQPKNSEAWEQSQEIVDDVLSMPVEDDIVGLDGALFFQHVNVPNWNPRRLERAGTIGNHKYYTLN